MDRAFTAFHEGLIDYAGLFPPAGLDMENAIRNYYEYRRGEDRFMLGRFICPAGRLEELLPLLDEVHREDDDPLPLSVLATAPKSRADFLANLDRDTRSVQAFAKKAGRRFVIQVRELKLAEKTADSGDADEIEACVLNTLQSWTSAGLRACPAFFEVSFGPDWRSTVAGVVDGLSAANARRKSVDAGLKIRCGGLDAAAFPSAEKVAFSVEKCRDAAVPFKATAGLHHAVGRFQRLLDTRMHGFLNLFGAAALAYRHGLDEAHILEIVEDQDSASFRFEDGRFAWRDLSASAGEVARARMKLAASFGSCSFDEPREELRELGWMDFHV